MVDTFPSFRWIDDRGTVYNLSNPPTVEVVDYQGIGMPPTSMNTTPSALFGSTVNLARFDSHPIVTVIKLQDENYNANQIILDSLRQALYPIGPNGPRTGEIEITRPNGRVTRIPAICESGLQQSDGWYHGPSNWVFAAIFRALRPTWRAVNYIQPIEESPLQLSGGIQWPLEWPITVSASRIQHRQSVPNIGDAVATIVEFTLIAGDQGLSNPTIVHDDSGRYAALTQSFTSGQKILFYNLTPDDIGVQAGNNDLAQFLDTASRAIPLYIGENNITVHCASGNGTVQMRYLPEYNGG